MTHTHTHTHGLAGSPYILFNTIPPITSFSDKRRDSSEGRKVQGKYILFRDFEAGCPSFHYYDTNN